MEERQLLGAQVAMEDSFAWSPDPSGVAESNIQAFMAQHGISEFEALVARSNSDPEWFWDAIFRFHAITFSTPYSRIVDLSDGIEWPKWCPGGTTNIVANCIDRHRGTETWQKAAVVSEAEDGRSRSITFEQLDRQVGGLASLLRRSGVGHGDVVGLYLPMIPEAAVAFLAVLKIGAIVLPLFSGFGPQSVSQRLGHGQARAVITTRLARRRGARIDMLSTIERAAELLGHMPTTIVLEQDTPDQAELPAHCVAWRVDADGATSCPTEIMDAEAPAMLMYTSGTTGAPKGTVHTHCGMLAKNALDMGICVDMRAGDRLLWMSDMGWIAGPKMILSATLLGATVVMVEGTPTWPSSARLFELIAKHRVTMLGIVPTIVRQMMATNPDVGREHDLSSLRIVVSAGEPWTEDAWWWFFNEVCRRAVPIFNYAGGTECGGAILVGTPLRPMRPGSFGGPVPGSGADIVDANGRTVPPGAIGELVMRQPSIGASRGLWREKERYIESYWTQIPGMWLQGDLASRDADGLWYLHGRSDDVIKVAGKRTGPAEIESAVLNTGLVRDCFIIGVTDAITGSALVCAYTSLATDDRSDLASTIGKAVADQCGSAFRPKHFLKVDDLPRTRNEKRMRRVVRSIILGLPIGDVSSCANPEAIDQIRTAKLAQLPAL